MNIIVRKSKSRGSINIPASKSDLHRAIIAASLANGTSIIQNATFSNDIEATINAVKTLGASVKLEKNTLIIQGIQNFNNHFSNVIDCQESGSTLRFIIPILSLFKSKFILKGKASLFNRPLNIYEEIYKNQKLKFEIFENHLNIEGKLKVGEYIIPGNVSSQFVTGLMFMLPLLKESSKIRILPPFESKSYINMTIKTLKEFGIDIHQLSEYEYLINGNQKYSPCTYKVEGDFSQLAFFAVLGAINHDVTCNNLNFQSLQGDKKILNILDAFNVKYIVGDSNITIYKTKKLEGKIIDLKDCIDLGPSLIILSLFNSKPVKIININRLRIKESDRIESMIINLKKLNAKIDVKDNEMIIYPSKLKEPQEILNPYNDHRILMSLVVLASVIKSKTIISNSSCVKKSYINFFKDIQSLGIDIGISNK